jgi:uncharacterized protein (DUF433 family)
VHVYRAGCKDPAAERVTVFYGRRGRPVKKPHFIPTEQAMPAQADLGWTGCPAVERHPLRVSGAWVFRGTRIPVAALFENLEDGVSMSEFVELFPGVTDQQARQVLEHVARSTAAVVA